ncbi:MAG: hypothetical protein BJ554DRAFT_5914, partial [Olpidium bornovanus]
CDRSSAELARRLASRASQCFPWRSSASPSPLPPARLFCALPSSAGALPPSASRPRALFAASASERSWTPARKRTWALGGETPTPANESPPKQGSACNPLTYSPIPFNLAAWWKYAEQTHFLMKTRQKRANREQLAPAMFLQAAGRIGPELAPARHHLIFHVPNNVPLLPHLPRLPHGLGMDEMPSAPRVTVIVGLPLVVNMKQCEVVALWHEELLPCRVRLLLPLLRSVEDRGHRQQGDDGLGEANGR